MQIFKQYVTRKQILLSQNHITNQQRSSFHIFYMLLDLLENYMKFTSVKSSVEKSNVK